MKRSIIAGLVIAVLLMSVFSPMVLADSPEEPWKPGKPFGAFQEPSDAMGELAEQGLDTPYGHEDTPIYQGDWEDYAGRPYYIGRVEFPPHPEE